MLYFYGLLENGDWFVYVLLDEILKIFLFCFSIVSSLDEEVLFCYSKKIGWIIFESIFKVVYYLEYDFLK